MKAKAENIEKGSELSGPFLFVVNPNSGTGTVKNFIEYSKSCDLFKRHKVVISKSGEHSVELAQKANRQGYAAVVAVGGDGSVHEIGKQLIHQQTSLGIIPTGSGNGIARHFGISMKVKEACNQILTGKSISIDTIKANEYLAIGFCGIGIDAHVADVFQNSKARGLNTYMKLTIDAFSNYKPTKFKLDGSSKDLKAYSVIAANINQFGNNAFINPDGIANDGLLELIIIKALPQLAFAEVASRLFLKSLHKSRHVQVIKAKKFCIENLGLAPFQIDGESIETANTFTFEVQENSLNIIIPKHGKQ